MVKGIINAFDHMELCFVTNLTKDGNWAITQPLISATGYISFATTFLYQVTSTCYLQKKLISNTALHIHLLLHYVISVHDPHLALAYITWSCDFALYLWLYVIL